MLPMKRLLFTSSILLFAAFTSLAQRAPSISSPEVHADNRVTFKYYSRNAQKVSLSGEFLTANQPLTKDTSGVWSITVGPVKPDIYPYAFWVDSVNVAEIGRASCRERVYI